MTPAVHAYAVSSATRHQFGCYSVRNRMVLVFEQNVQMFQIFLNDQMNKIAKMPKTANMSKMANIDYKFQ